MPQGPSVGVKASGLRIFTYSRIHLRISFGTTTNLDIDFSSQKLLNLSTVQVGQSETTYLF